MSFECDVLTDEVSMEYFCKPAKEMYKFLYLIMVELGMTKDNATRVCNISKAYFDIFEYKHRLDRISNEGIKLLDKWRFDFGNKEKEEEFISLLLKED